MGKMSGSKIRNLARVEMELHNVIYLSYSLPLDMVRPLVPSILPLAAVGDDTVFISIVLLRSQAVHPTIIPAPRFNYEQINIRTYVRDPQSGENGVYFLRSAISSSFISSITKSIGLTWEYRIIDRMETVGKDNGITINIKGKWYADFDVEVNAGSSTTPQYKPFKSAKDAADYLIRPLMGFFGDVGKLKRFRIWHPPVEPKSANLTRADFPLNKLLKLDYKPDLSAPHSIFLVKNARFYIYLPPVGVNN